ncbi:hypothetical protein CFP56_012152 [Quercus suber]|uniref:Secreted protein n=1 Tax=Quercus suber TaxID=58331 RepID=A0AAW0KWF0_QUESU
MEVIFLSVSFTQQLLECTEICILVLFNTSNEIANEIRKEIRVGTNYYLILKKRYAHCSFFIIGQISVIHYLWRQSGKID